MSRTRSFLTTSLFGLAAAYIGGWFVALGGFYPDIAAEVAPTRDPLRLLNEHLLSGMAGLVAVRFFLQRFDAGEDHLLLCLPLRRTTLVRALQVALAVSLLNLLPLLSLATLAVLIVLAVGPLLLAMPVVGWADPFFAVPMAAFALYHAGISVPTVVWTGVLWNRNWVNPEQSRFTVSGGSMRGVILMALLGLPPTLFAALGGPPAVLVGVAALGGMGLGTASLWLPRLEAALRRRRHAMLRGFRGGWLSPHEWHW